MYTYPNMMRFLSDMTEMADELKTLRAENKHLNDIIEIQREQIKIWNPQIVE